MGRKQGVHVNCYQCNEARHMAWDCLGKETEDERVLISSPRQHIDKMLPVIWIHANETLCSAVLNSGCSHAIVSVGQCCIWKKCQNDPLISSEMHTCYGIEIVKIHIDAMNSADIKARMVHEKPLNWPMTGLWCHQILGLCSHHSEDSEPVKLQNSIAEYYVYPAK